jgi:hypothetical protein
VNVVLTVFDIFAWSTFFEEIREFFKAGDAGEVSCRFFAQCHKCTIQIFEAIRGKTFSIGGVGDDDER